MMSHLTGNSSLAFLMPRAEASMNERSPNGLGVISAQVNCGASAAGASVAGAAGVAPQAVSTSDATTKKLKTKSKLFFISFLLWLICLRKFIDRFINILCHHLLNQKNMESLHRTTC